jgi:hypothetical protein
LAGEKVFCVVQQRQAAAGSSNTAGDCNLGTPDFSKRNLEVLSSLSARYDNTFKCMCAAKIQSHAGVTRGLWQAGFVSVHAKGYNAYYWNTFCCPSLVPTSLKLIRMQAQLRTASRWCEIALYPMQNSINTLCISLCDTSARTHVNGLAFGTQALLLLPITPLHSLNRLIGLLQRRFQGPAASGSQEASNPACSGELLSSAHVE